MPPAPLPGRRTIASPIARLLAAARWLCVLAAACPLAALATGDWMSGQPVTPGAAGLGLMMRSERSPYEGADIRHDLVPLYLYEGERFFLHPTRAGLKLSDDRKHRFDLFLDLRLEGFPHDKVPASLAGMQMRESTTDVGVSYTYRAPWGNLQAEFVHDALNITKGQEARLGYSYNWNSGRWHLRPSVTVSLRSAALNNYYYGVQPVEATADRPAYMPGSGANFRLGVFGYYDLSGGWRVLGGLGLSRLDGKVRDSPIVRDSLRPAVFLGAVYDFGSHHRAFEESEPLVVKLLYGKSTDCNLNKILVLNCGSTDTEDETRIAGVELGRPFVTRLNGWPLDFVGYVGLLHRDESGLQPAFLQFNAYMKGFYYGFPWSGRVRTRLGFGAGISVAHRVPSVERRDQALRGRGTSRVLNYLDPSIDFSIGDLVGSRALKETYLGVGVSHRSGIFGSSRMLGNVNGGANYIYTYLEWKMK